MTTHPTSLSALLTDMQDQAKLAPLMPVSVRDRLSQALAAALAHPPANGDA